MTSQLTPREIVSELDRYIVGQNKAKRAVAIALRNRWRRQQVAPELRDEIAPKNIIMIGPTGVGKTEIARRLAKLAHAPFVKVEASKFTEVGYVGRDVDSMIRDLTETAVQMVRKEALEQVKVRAEEIAEERLIDLLSDDHTAHSASAPQMPTVLGPFVVSSNGEALPPHAAVSDAEREVLRERLRKGELDEQEIELEVADSGNPAMTVMGFQGMEDMELQIKDMIGRIPGLMGQSRGKQRRTSVADARRLIENEEAQKLIDMERVQRDAITRVEQAGIVFLDEIDKIAGRQTGMGGPDVSREGVQRDLLPVVEGSTVNTKYGPVKTDHILFIAAGAFHVAKVSDLIPELQGRFPIRVELDSLVKDDFVRILTEPKNALTVQYKALLATEGVDVTFKPDAIEALAESATETNKQAENIGARRLHTLLEALLEEVSFKASEMNGQALIVDAGFVRDKLGKILANQDLARYIL